MAEIRDLNVVDDNNTARFPEGQPPSSVNDGARAGEGIDARGYKDTIDTTLVSTGTSLAYAVTTNRGVPDAEAGLYEGFTLTFRVHETNGTSPTLTVTMLTTAQPAKNIVDQSGQGLIAGNLFQNGYCTVIYSAALDAFVVQSMMPSPVQADTDPKLGGNLNVNGFSIISDTSIDIPLAPGSGGNVSLSAIKYPNADGTAGQILETDGAGTISFVDKPVAVLSQEFISAEQTISPGSMTTVAHTLGVLPKVRDSVLVCKSAEDGYSVGEEVDTSNMEFAQSGVNAQYNYTISADATNFYITYGAQGLNFFNKTTGVPSGKTAGNWRVVIRAYA